MSKAPTGPELGALNEIVAAMTSAEFAATRLRELAPGVDFDAHAQNFCISSIGYIRDYYKGLRDREDDA